MDDVALRCRCGNVGLCLRAPLNEVDLHQLPQAVPLGLHQRLGVADLISVFHRVPELVRASERLSDCSSAKWRCYECRICCVEVYACRIGESPQSNPFAREVQIVTEGILLNLELAAATLANDLPLTVKKEESYSHVFRVDLSLVSAAPGHSTDISKLLGAAGVDGLKLFERLTDEVDNWVTQHLRDLAFTDAGKVTKEQEASIRKKALRERDIIFSKICQENGIGGDLASLARAAEALGSAINKGALLMGDDDDMDDDGDFEARCQDLEEFKERHGHCRVPRGWRENVNLSNWVRNLRRKKIRGTLSSEKIAKLEELGFVWRKERKDSWEEHFAQLIEFKERFGHCRVSRNWKENVKLGQWVQSLRRLKLSGRLADDKIARLESIGFEWRLRQKEDGPGHEFRDGEQVDAYDDHSADSVDANSDEDFVTTENDEPTQTKSEARMDRWRSYALREDMSPTKDHQPQRIFAYYDSLRMEELTTTKSSTATTTTTKTATVTTASTTTTTMRNKKAKVRLPRSPTFSLNDLDETLHEKYGHAKYDYDDDDDDDEEFDAALDDEEEDDDWEDGSRSTSRAKRKRTKEKPKGRHVSHDSDKRPMSPLANKSGVRACVECGATKTPHWRRGPSDKHGDPAFLCNACGLRYYKTLQQKSSGKKKKKRTPKKQKTYRGTGSQEEALPASPETKREAKKKKKKKDRKNEGSEEKTTIVPEAVTDSDSESRDGHIVGRFRANEKEPTAGESAIASHQEEATAAGEEESKAQAAGGENAHMPWLLAFKQKRKDGLTTAAARDQPTTIAHE